MQLTYNDQKIIENQIQDEVSKVETQHGGCISHSLKVTSKQGVQYFVKSSLPGMDLIKEANGLKEIAKSLAIKTPNIHFASRGLLVLEWIEAQAPGSHFYKEFARQLASMHRYTSSAFGFYEDSYIGSLPQENPQSASSKNEWTRYFLQHRLFAQMNLAEKNGYADATLIKSMASLEQLVPIILEGSLEPPCLIHGDLWSGNYIVGPNQVPYLIDPAVYYGHREVDIAMTKLFGGFPKEFYQAYNEAYPLPRGFEKRCGLYQLYFLLVHLNLFGPSYYQQCLGLIQRLRDS